MRRRNRCGFIDRIAVAVFLLAPTLAFALKPAPRAWATAEASAATPRFTLKSSGMQATPQQSGSDARLKSAKRLHRVADCFEAHSSMSPLCAFLRMGNRAPQTGSRSMRAATSISTASDLIVGACAVHRQVGSRWSGFGQYSEQFPPYRSNNLTGTWNFNLWINGQDPTMS